jgi:hypothetical protein
MAKIPFNHAEILLPVTSMFKEMFRLHSYFL